MSSPADAGALGTRGAVGLACATERMLGGAGRALGGEGDSSLVGRPGGGYTLERGGVAQLVRACGSYPQSRWFESTRRYQVFIPCLARRRGVLLLGLLPGERGTRVKVAWSIAGGCALLAALATWLIGFIQPQESFITTTLALLMGVGGFWMAEHRRRRWGVPLVIATLGVSLFVANADTGYPLWRIPLGVTALLFALVGATMRPKPRKDPDEAEEPGGGP